MEKGTSLSDGLTEEQRGWIVTALIVFLGVSYIGPALARLNEKQRQARHRMALKAAETRGRLHASSAQARRKVRRLGGGSIWR